jgi:hypothetical protein
MDSILIYFQSGAEIALYSGVFLLWAASGAVAAASGFMGRLFSALAYESARHWADAEVMLESDPDRVQRVQRAVIVHRLLSLSDRSEYSATKVQELRFQAPMTHREARALGRIHGQWIAAKLESLEGDAEREGFEKKFTQLID